MPIKEATPLELAVFNANAAVRGLMMARKALEHEITTRLHKTPLTAAYRWERSVLMVTLHHHGSCRMVDFCVPWILCMVESVFEEQIKLLTGAQS